LQVAILAMQIFSTGQMQFYDHPHLGSINYQIS
jgi:hypothetical protein